MRDAREARGMCGRGTTLYETVGGMCGKAIDMHLFMCDNGRRVRYQLSGSPALYVQSRTTEDRMARRRGIVRAESQGRRTRHVDARHKPHKVRPLPIRLAVHPQRAMPTPRHPGCATYDAQWGTAVDLARNGLPWFIAANGLRKRRPRGQSCTYKVQDLAGVTVGWATDVVYAMGWKRAAAMCGFTVNVIEVRK